MEQSERKDFIMDRLRNGFSFIQTQKQFMEKFNCSLSSARSWVKEAVESATDEDPKKRRRVHTVIVEMYHTQITSYQTELLAMQREIDLLRTSIKRRNEIYLALPRADDETSELLKAELATIPEPGPLAIAQLIESKTRIRERMIRVIADLARLQGVGSTSDWKHALNVLLDNNLIPPALADQILQAIDAFDSTVRATGLNLAVKVNPKQIASSIPDGEIIEVEAS